MTKKLAHNIRFYYGGYDPGTATTSVSVGLECEALDQTAITDTAERGTAGERKDVLTYAGLFDDGSGGLDDAQSALLATGTAVASVLVGTNSGDVAYSGTAYLLSAKPAASRGELVKLEATFKPDQAWDRGKVIADKATITGTGVAGSLDEGASAALVGARWYLHVFSYTGAGTCTVYFQGSGGTSWTSVGSAVGITGPMSAKTIITTSAVRHTRVIGTMDGTAAVTLTTILARI